VFVRPNTRERERACSEMFEMFVDQRQSHPRLEHLLCARASAGIVLLACCRFRGRRDRVLREPEASNAEAQVQSRVQDRGRPPRS
jgi:hypothetical protein